MVKSTGKPSKMVAMPIAKDEKKVSKKNKNSEDQTNHRGIKVKEIILAKGKKLKFVAEKLKINRQTLYTKLQNAKISNYYIREIGKIIGYDFSEIFPEIEKINLISDKQIDAKDYQSSLEKKYAEAIEVKQELYEFIVKLSYLDSLAEVKKKIQKLIVND